MELSPSPNIFKRLRDRLLCRKRDKADKSEPQLEDSTFEKDGRWSEIPMGSRGESVVDKNGNCITPREDGVANIGDKYTRRYVSLRAEVSDIRKGAQTLDDAALKSSFGGSTNNVSYISYDTTPVATRPGTPVVSRLTTPQGSPREFHLPKPNFKPVYDESPVATRPNSPQESPEFHLPKPNFKPVYDESPVASRPCSPQGSPRGIHLPKPNFRPVYDESPVVSRAPTPQDSPREFHLPKPNFRPVYDESPIASRQASPVSAKDYDGTIDDQEAAPFDCDESHRPVPRMNIRPLTPGSDESSSTVVAFQQVAKKKYGGLDHMRQIRRENAIRQKRMKVINARKNGQPATVSKVADSGVNHQRKELVQYSPSQEFDVEQDDVTLDVHSQDDTPVVPVGNDDNESDYQESDRPSDRPASKVFVFRPVAAKKYGGLGHMRQIQRENALRKERMKNIGKKVDDVKETPASQGNSARCSHGEDYPIGPGDYGSVSHNKMVKADNMARQKRLKGIKSSLPCWQTPVKDYSYSASGCAEYGSVQHHHMAKSVNASLQKKVGAVKSKVVSCWQKPSQPKREQYEQEAEYGSVGFFKKAKQNGGGSSNQLKNVQSKIKTWSNAMTTAERPQWSQRDETAYHQKVGRDQMHEQMPPDNLKNVKSKINTWNQPTRPVQHSQWNQPDETAFQHEVGRDQMHQPMPLDKLKNVKSKLNTWNQPTRPVQHSQWNQPDETAFQHEVGRDQMHQPMPLDKLKNVKSKLNTWNQPTRPVQHSQWNQPDETEFHHEVGRDQMHQPLPPDKLKNVKSKINTWNQSTRPVQHSQWNQPDETEFHHEVGRDQMYQPMPPDKLKNVKSKINTWNQPTRPVQHSQWNQPDETEFHHEVGRNQMHQPMPPDNLKNVKSKINTWNQPTRTVQHSQWNQPDETDFQQEVGRDQMYQPMPPDLKNVKSKINTWNQPTRTVQHSQWNQPDETDFQQEVGRDQMYQPMPPGLKNVKSKINTWNQPTRPVQNAQRNHPNDAAYHHNVGRDELAQHMPPDMAKQNGGAGSYQLKNVKSKINTWNKPKTTVQHPQWNQPDEPTFHQSRLHPIGRYDMHQQMPPVDRPDMYAEPYLSPRRRMHLDDLKHQRGRMVSVDTGGRIAKEPQQDDRRLKEYYTLPTMHGHGFSPGMPANIPDGISAPVPASSRQEHFPTAAMAQRSGMPANIPDHSCVPLPPIMNQKQYNSTSKIPIYRSADNAAASMTSQDHFPTMEMMQRYQPGMPASIAERNGVPLPPIMSQKQHNSNSKIPIYSRYGHEPAQNIATQELSQYMPGHGSTMRMPGYEPSNMAATMCAGNTMRPPVNSSWNGVSTPMPPRQEHFPTVDHERMGSGVGRDQRSREVDRGIGVGHDTEVTPVNTPPLESPEDALAYKKRILGYLTSYKKWKSNQDDTGRRPDHYTTYLSAIQDVDIRDELRAHMLKQTRHEYRLSDGAAKKPGWENELPGRDSVYSPSPGSNRSSGSRSDVLADQDAHSDPYRGPNG